MMDADLYVELGNLLKSFATTDSHPLVFHIQPFDAPAVKKGEERGGNSLGISPVNQACKLIS
jgi:hypothetical protein